MRLYLTVPLRPAKDVNAAEVLIPIGVHLTLEGLNELSAMSVVDIYGQQRNLQVVAKSSRLWPHHVTLRLYVNLCVK
jgi:hypothetical protein